jgi:predicted small secreted protein
MGGQRRTENLSLFFISDRPIIYKKQKETFERSKKMVKKALLIIMLLFVLLAATSCQTMQGLGGDIRWLAGARDNYTSSE